MVERNMMWPRNQRRQQCVFGVSDSTSATGPMKLEGREKHLDLKAISMLSAHGHGELK